MRTKTIGSDALSYIYLAVAIMGLGYTAFPLSPRNSPTVTAHLLEITGVVQLFVSDDPSMQTLAKESAKLLAERGREVELLPMVKFADLKRDSSGFSHEVEKGVTDIADDETAIILHSSGEPITPPYNPSRIAKWSLQVRLHFRSPSRSRGEAW